MYINVKLMLYAMAKIHEIYGGKKNQYGIYIETDIESTLRLHDDVSLSHSKIQRMVIFLSLPFASV